MMKRLLLLMATIILVLASTSFWVTVMAQTTFEPSIRPRIDVKKTTSSIKIDGHLDDEGWQRASRAANFTERNPGEMTKPEVETEVLITYDDDRLYVAFICQDDPCTIRASMTQRDQFEGDDAVALQIDPYGDASWAYTLRVNPYGIQGDQIWTSIGGDDSGFDLIWESAAQITDSGYQVEIAVPFTSMRFPSKDVQQWKIDFLRDRPRESFCQYSWAAYDRNEDCWVCQWGTIDGIANVQPGKGFELLPSIVATHSGALEDRNDPASWHSDRNITDEYSIGAKYSISSNMAAEATLNPDFSQIESDADQIDINTTIALFYPERRPFFQEGSDIFRTLFNSFYTRMVNDPQYAVKLTGRTERNSIGFLSALDENTPYMIPLDEKSIVKNTGKSYVNAIRILRTIGEDRQIGLIATDRRLEGGGSGTIVALDGDVRLTRSLSVDGQYVLSHTTEPDEAGATAGLDSVFVNDGRISAVFDGQSFTGTGLITRIKNFTRNMALILTYDQVSPSYRTETGYDPWVNYRNLKLYSARHFYFKDGLFERISPVIETQARWHFDGNRKWAQMDVRLVNYLRLAQTKLRLIYHRSSESWFGQKYTDLWSFRTELGSRLCDEIGYQLNVSHGTGVAISARTIGKEISVDASLDLKPIDRMIIEPSFEYSRSTNVATGDELYSGYITRTKLRLQVNRDVSLRLVVQYNDFRRTWDVDPLITFRLNPFSAIYAGMTSDFQRMEIVTADDRYTYSTRLLSRQFFLKLQYLFRL